MNRYQILIDKPDQYACLRRKCSCAYGCWLRDSSCFYLPDLRRPLLNLEEIETEPVQVLPFNRESVSEEKWATAKVETFTTTVNYPEVQERTPEEMDSLRQKMRLILDEKLENKSLNKMKSGGTNAIFEL